MLFTQLATIVRHHISVKNWATDASTILVFGTWPEKIQCCLANGGFVKDFHASSVSNSKLDFSLVGHMQCVCSLVKRRYS